MPTDHGSRPPDPTAAARSIVAAFGRITEACATLARDVQEAIRPLVEFGQSEQGQALIAAVTEPRRRWRFVPGTMILEPEGGRPFDRLTAEEVQRQQMPPCPSCGATIHLDWIDVHTHADREPMYIPGAWGCPADPRHPHVGERTDQ